MKFIQILLIMGITLVFPIHSTQAQKTTSKTIEAIKADNRLNASFKEKASNISLIDDSLPPWFLTRNVNTTSLKIAVNSFEEAALKGEGNEIIPAKIITSTRLKYPGKDKPALVSRLKYYAERLESVYRQK